MAEMNQDVLQLVTAEMTTFTKKQITTVLQLLQDGNTVPFIARYRKEMTNGLDEVQIRDIEERYTYVENLEKRKAEVLRLIEEQDKLTPELQQAILAAAKMQTVEDLYRPYKQKGRKRRSLKKMA